MELCKATKCRKRRQYLKSTHGEHGVDDVGPGAPHADEVVSMHDGVHVARHEDARVGVHPPVHRQQPVVPPPRCELWTRLKWPVLLTLKNGRSRIL